MRKSKKERQEDLLETIELTPFITDEQLAKKFGVSIQTIRLDRLELAIPELRERIKSVAKSTWVNKVKALPPEDIVGEVIDLELGKRAISLFVVEKDHLFSRNKIVRGHHLFAQANSLAVAVINDDFAVTAKSEVQFKKQVHLNERVVAKANVLGQDEKGYTTVEVKSFVEQELVFTGFFHMYHFTK